MGFLIWATLGAVVGYYAAAQRPGLSRTFGIVAGIVLGPRPGYCSWCPASPWMRCTSDGARTAPARSPLTRASATTAMRY